MKDKFTKEERALIEILSTPPKCMHGDPLGKLDITDLGDYWKCNRCGLIAKKSIGIEPGIFVWNG